MRHHNHFEFHETRRELDRSLISAGLFLVHLGCLTCGVIGYLDLIALTMLASVVDAMDCFELDTGTTVHAAVFGLG